MNCLKFSMIWLTDERRSVSFHTGTILCHSTGVQDLAIKATERNTNAVLRNEDMTDRDILIAVTGAKSHVSFAYKKR